MEGFKPEGAGVTPVQKVLDLLASMKVKGEAAPRV